jgi:hypothetical protein
MKETNRIYSVFHNLTTLYSGGKLWKTRAIRVYRKSLLMRQRTGITYVRNHRERQPVS